MKQQLAKQINQLDELGDGKATEKELDDFYKIMRHVSIGLALESVLKRVKLTVILQH